MNGPTYSSMGSVCGCAARRVVNACKCWSLMGYAATAARQLLAFLRSQGESQAAWEGLLEDLYRRGLVGEHLQLIVTDGCPGLAAAIQTVYARVPHQRCWVHKMRKILKRVRRRDFPA